MDSMIPLVELSPDQISSSDAIYDEIRFTRTDPACTRMLGAFADDALVGLGRLIDLGGHGGAQHYELGGMWVHPSRRRTGLAKRIIRLVAEWAPAEGILWCTPFAHLEPLYGDHGFVSVPTDAAPPKLMERLAGCASTQDQDVIVMRWQPA